MYLVCTCTNVESVLLISDQEISDDDDDDDDETNYIMFVCSSVAEG